MDLAESLAKLEDIHRRYHSLVDPQGDSQKVLIEFAQAAAKEIAATNSALEALAGRVAALESHQEAANPFESAPAAPKGADNSGEPKGPEAPAGSGTQDDGGRSEGPKA